MVCCRLLPGLNEYNLTHESARSMCQIDAWVGFYLNWLMMSKT